MKVVTLKAENFKNLTALEIKLNTKGAIITGDNGAGKSNVLDVLETAFGGKNAAPLKPIKHGADTARIVVETENIIVKRKFTAKGSYLEITSIDGKQNYKSPQALLDRLMGKISFDPLAFSQMKPAEQRQVILEMTELDLTEFDEKYAVIKSDRSISLQLVKAAEGQLAAMTFTSDLPVEEIDQADLLAKLDEAHKHNNSITEAKALQDQLESKETEIASAVESEKKEIERHNQRIQEMLASKAEALKVHEKHLAEHEEAKLAFVKQGALVVQMQPVDTEPIQNDLATLQATNAKIRDNGQYKTTEQALAGYKGTASGQLQAMNNIKDEKTTALAKAKMPIEGLSIDDEQVLYNNLPLSGKGTNHAKQLEVCVAMGMAMNPKLNVMLLNINGIGDETLAAIQKLAEGHDPPYQLLMELFDTSGKVGIYICDGAVESIDGKPVEESS